MFIKCNLYVSVYQNTNFTLYIIKTLQKNKIKNKLIYYSNNSIHFFTESNSIESKYHLSINSL